MLKQVNNMKIKFKKLYNVYTVYSPDKIALEEFKTLEDAIAWATITKDFIKRK